MIQMKNLKQNHLSGKVDSLQEDSNKVNMTQYFNGGRIYAQAQGVY
jgi:hypothetical protein